MCVAAWLTVQTRKLPAGVGLPVGGGKSDVKRAYLKTIRVVHPDKVNALPLRQQIESRLVFNTISEAYVLWGAACALCACDTPFRVLCLHSYTKYQEAGPDMNAGRYSYSRSGASSSRRTTWSAAGSGTASHHRHSGRYVCAAATPQCVLLLTVLCAVGSWYPVPVGGRDVARVGVTHTTKRVCVRQQCKPRTKLTLQALDRIAQHCTSNNINVTAVLCCAVLCCVITHVTPRAIL